MTKTKVRRQLAQLRASIPSQTKIKASEAACEHLRRSAIWPAKTLGLFAPLADEADPSLLAGDVSSVGYPQVLGDDLVFRLAPLSELSPVPPYGVREPDDRFKIIEAFEIIVVPGLGFTRRGQRIGYGKGYYDRYLKLARSRQPKLITVGLCFDIQVTEDLPIEAHDEPLDAIVTESGFYPCRLH